MDKQSLQDRQQKIIGLIREFCSQQLNEEYFELSEKLIQKLGRKKNPPIATGQPQIWAAAAIHAIGTVNFLFDKSGEPYVSIDDINAFFETSKSTTGNKSKLIRDLLHLVHMDKEFSTKKILDNNPFANLVMVNGFIVPENSINITTSKSS